MYRTTQRRTNNETTKAYREVRHVYTNDMKVDPLFFFFSPLKFRVQVQQARKTGNQQRQNAGRRDSVETAFSTPCNSLSFASFRVLLQEVHESFVVELGGDARNLVPVVRERFPEGLGVFAGVVLLQITAPPGGRVTTNDSGRRRGDALMSACMRRVR